MTQRLYYSDSYLRDFEAAVVDRSDNGRRIYLDRTAFYPTSGGQPFDTGRLGGVEVTEVIDEGERIAHLLASPLSAQRVAGSIDWGRRFDHMQQHTGQHLLSALLAELMGYTTVGVHFGRDTSTLDVEAAGLTAEQMTDVEAKANEVVFQNRPVQVSFEDPAASAGLRKPSDRVGPLRIVAIHDLDRSACGGTHVRATGEIGAVLVRKAERARKGTRVEFLCGGRAIRQARWDHELLTRIAGEFSASAAELPGLIESQRNALKEASAERSNLQHRLDQHRARELYAASPPDAAGLRRVTVRDEDATLEELRGLAQEFTSMPRAIFIGTTQSPSSVILAVSGDAGVDAASVLKSLLASAGGRGGGSARMAQGMVPGKAQLERILESIGRGVDG